MKKSNRFSSLSACLPISTGVLCLLLLHSCGKEGQVSGQLISNAPEQTRLNPLSKGEQLNPISKGEQLNPSSKGERIVSGELSLLGADPFIATHTLSFFLDGKAIPADWLRLSYEGQQTLRYQIQNMPAENMHILEVRYLDEGLSAMVPPEKTADPTVLDLNLYSSFVVSTIRFADAQAILRFADWTPELLHSLEIHEELAQLVSRFKTENAKQTPTQLNQWATQSDVQQELQAILNSLR